MVQSLLKGRNSRKKQIYLKKTKAKIIVIFVLFCFTTKLKFREKFECKKSPGAIKQRSQFLVQCFNSCSFYVRGIILSAATSAGLSSC